MRAMMMMFGSAEGMTGAQSPEWVTEMITFMRAFDAELRESGELVHNEGLADPSQARIVSRIDDTVTVRDGSRTDLIGWWVLDVADEARMVELAGRVCQWSGSVELRPIPSGPPGV